MNCPPVLNPAACSPRLYLRFLESGSEMWRATASGLTDYWAGAAGRGATAWDVMTDVASWWRASTRRERPVWHSANEVVLETPVARLRDFSAGSADDVVPTLVLPPQAGHDSC